MKPQNSPGTEAPHQVDPISSLSSGSHPRAIEVELVDSTTVLRINPELKRISNTAEAAHALLRDITEAIALLPETTDRIVLSMNGIEYLGNSGVGVLLQIHQGATRDRFPPFAVADLGEQPREKLHLTRIDTLIPTFETTAAACADTSWPKAA